MSIVKGRWAPTTNQEMSKNIVILLDGTWNGRPDKSKDLQPTNVYKLFKTLSNDSREQTAAYFPGVGATPTERARGGALGYGMSRSIVAAYQFIFRNFNAEDDLFLFGFSRGAAAARILATWLDRLGLLPRDAISEEDATRLGHRQR